MPCEWYRTSDGKVIHLNVAAGRKRRCEDCGEYTNEMKLCDFPLGNGKTCDAEICPNCTAMLGSQETVLENGWKRLGDSIDLCALHRDKAFVRDGKLVLNGN